MPSSQTKQPNDPIEIRTCRDNQDILVVVSLTGEMKLQFGHKNTEQANIRISSRNPILFTFEDWDELIQVVEEAKETLRNLETCDASTSISQGQEISPARR
jgi:hypothetical protein